MSGEAGRILIKIYNTLYKTFGPQHWWPGRTPFEVAVGAVLTQNTNWGNVEKAIGNLKRAGALSAKKLHGMSPGRVAALVRPAGYFNVKARRLKAFIDFLMEDYRGSMALMKKEDALQLREKLLGINGVGPETADSILLYALEKPVFVIDAYTKRVLSRHGIMGRAEPYEKFQELFHGAFAATSILPKKRGSMTPGSVTPFFNEYHALFVRLGKTYCRPRPLCGDCPMSGLEKLARGGRA